MDTPSPVDPLAVMQEALLPPSEQYELGTATPSVDLGRAASSASLASASSEEVGSGRALLTVTGATQTAGASALGKPPALAEQGSSRGAGAAAARSKSIAAMRRLTANERRYYIIGVLDAVTTAFVTGYHATGAALWFLLKTAVMLSMRWVNFKAVREHWLLADFCYTVNFGMVGFAVLYCTGWDELCGPSARAVLAWLYRAVFALATGPLLASIVGFDNKLRFHSAQHVTSVFIHVAPATLAWALQYTGHWRLPYEGSWGFAQLYISGIVWHGVWLGLYSALVWGACKHRIARKRNVTLFEMVTKSKRSALGKLLRKHTSSERQLKVAYCAVHVFCNSCALLGAPLWWSHRVPHGAVVVAAIAASAWNASSGYALVYHPRSSEKQSSKASAGVSSPAPHTESSQHSKQE